MPIISIIVPIYNVEEYLPRCINSILAQSLSDLELILVDDGSTDGCPEICDRYAQKDRRIIVIHQENRGQAAARNAGLDIASGSFIGFVDGDDWIHKDMYQDMIDRAIKYNADMIVCGIENLDQNGNKLENWQQINSEIICTKEDILRSFYPFYFNNIKGSVCNKVFRACVFGELRFPVGQLYEDSYVLLDTICNSERIVLIKEYYYMYFSTRCNSTMHYQYSVKSFETLSVTRKNYIFFSETDNLEQAKYAMEYYVNDYLKHWLTVRLCHRELKSEFRKYEKEFPMFCVIRSHAICKMKKVAFLLSCFAPGLSLSLCKKLFPECIPSELTK